MRFYTGQPVICIDDRFDSRWWRRHRMFRNLTTPIKGQRYTVRVVQREVSFAETRFAPVTDISDLEKLLTMATEDA